MISPLFFGNTHIYSIPKLNFWGHRGYWRFEPQHHVDSSVLTDGISEARHPHLPPLLLRVCSGRKESVLECKIWSIPGGGFNIFFWIFIPTWGDDPIWLMFFNWVGTTNLANISKLEMMSRTSLSQRKSPERFRKEMMKPWKWRTRRMIWAWGGRVRSRKNVFFHQPPPKKEESIAAYHPLKLTARTWNTGVSWFRFKFSFWKLPPGRC